MQQTDKDTVKHNPGEPNQCGATNHSGGKGIRTRIWKAEKRLFTKDKQKSNKQRGNTTTKKLQEAK